MFYCYCDITKTFVQKIEACVPGTHYVSLSSHLPCERLLQLQIVMKTHHNGTLYVGGLLCNRLISLTLDISLNMLTLNFSYTTRLFLPHSVT